MVRPLRSSVAASKRILIDYDKFPLTRSTEASALAGASVVKWYGPNELRKEDRGDGNGREPLFEGEFIQEFSAAADLTNGSSDFVWPNNVGSITASVGAAPDGTNTAFEVDMPTDTLFRQDVVVPNNVNINFALWIKNISGDGNMRLRARQKDGATFEQTSDKNIGSTWTYLSLSANVGSGSSNPRFIIQKRAGDGVMHLWLPNLVQSDFPLSVRRENTPFTQSADQLTIPAANVPSEMLDGRWEVDIYPYHKSTDGNNAFNFRLFEFGSGTNTIKVSSGRKFSIVVDGEDKFETGNLGWDRHEKLSVKIDTIAGYIYLNGTQFGSHIGFNKAKAWKWTTSNDLSVATNGNGIFPFFGRISEPRRWNLPYNFEEIPNRVLDLDADDVVLSAGVATAWSSSVGGHIATASVGEEPGFVASTSSFNGRSIVTFDGANQTMTIPHDPSLSNSENGLEIFMVGTFYSGSTNQRFLNKWTGGREYIIRGETNNDLAFYIRNGADTNSYNPIDAGRLDPTLESSVINASFSASDGPATLRANGNTEQTDSSETGFNTGSADLILAGDSDGTQKGKFDVTRIVQFNRTLTDEEKNVVYHTLNKKYGIRK